MKLNGWTQWRAAHPDRYKKSGNEFRNSKKGKKAKKLYGARFWKKNKIRLYKKHKAYLKNNPWVSITCSARSRCRNPNQYGYSYYGGRGIECMLTLKQVRKLWFRDKAHTMQRPSLDRINSDGNYTFNNCRFIELRENISRATKGRISAEILEVVGVLIHDRDRYLPYIELKAKQIKPEQIKKELIAKFKGLFYEE